MHAEAHFISDGNYAYTDVHSLTLVFPITSMFHFSYFTSPTYHVNAL